MRMLALLRAALGGCLAHRPDRGRQRGRTAFVLLVRDGCLRDRECLHGAVRAPLVADLAEPRLLGRYMALYALSWQVGFALGPAVGGFGLAVSPSGVWIGAAALCAVGGALAALVEATLPARARRNADAGCPPRLDGRVRGYNRRTWL